LSLQTIARRYASALADVAVARREDTEVEKEIKGWAEILDENPTLREVFANPTVAYDQKRKVLEELIKRTKVRETTASFLRVLLQNQRLAELKYIAERLSHLLDDRRGVVSANVTTARPLNQDLQAALREAMTAVAGRSVRLSFATNEAIIGGVVTQIGSTIYDGSVEGQLQRLAADLVNS